MNLNIFIQGNTFPQKFIVGLTEQGLLYSARYKYQDEDPNGEDIPHSAIARAHGLDLSPERVDVFGGGNVTLLDEETIKFGGVSGRFGAVPSEVMEHIELGLIESYSRMLPRLKRAKLSYLNTHVKPEVFDTLDRIRL